MIKITKNSPDIDGNIRKIKSTMTTNFGSVGGVNVLIYMLCVISMGFSVYTSLCQTQIENRIRHFHHLDDRISVLEAKLRIFPIQFLQSLATLPSTTLSASSPSSSTSTSLPTNNNVTSETLSTSSWDDTAADGFSNIVRKLSLQISGIQRLRRDVTYLKASRRGERQASVQTNSECTCPPGKYKCIYK